MDSIRCYLKLGLYEVGKMFIDCIFGCEKLLFFKELFGMWVCYVVYI